MLKINERHVEVNLNRTSHIPLHTSQRGITLIALIITIIIMLILVGVTITVAVNGGLFNYAGKARKETNEAIEGEQKLATLEDNMSTDELIDYYTREWTPLEDWEYYYGNKKLDYYGDESEYLTVPEGYVLLRKYIGLSKIVNIPNEYIIDNGHYKVIVFMDTANLCDTAFYGNNNIEEVYFANNIEIYNYDDSTTLVSTNSIFTLFAECSSLKKVSGIPKQITNVFNAFFNDINLEEIEINSTEIDKADGVFHGITKPIIVKVPKNSNTYNTFMNCKSNNSLTEVDDSVVIIETY